MPRLSSSAVVGAAAAAVTSSGCSSSDTGETSSVLPATGEMSSVLAASAATYSRKCYKIIDRKIHIARLLTYFLNIIKLNL